MPLSLPFLNYAPLPLRRKMRYVCAFIGIMLLGIAIWHWGSRVWNHMATLYWQQYYMNYLPPKQQIVYEEGPVQAKHLMATNYHYKPVWIREDHSGATAPSWIGLYLPSNGYIDFPQPCLFIHERKTASGNERLIVVSLSIDYASDHSRTLYISAVNIAPIKWFSGPTSTPAEGYGGFFITLKAKDALSIYAGHPDPKDSSRFKIPYELNGKAGLIIGKVAKNGKIKLNVSGPADTRTSPERPGQ
jgi:hypothetical protein